MQLTFEEVADPEPTNNPVTPIITPAVSPSLDGLRALAELTVVDYRGTKRPTWAPTLVIDDAFADLLRRAQLLREEDKSVVRLWADFSKPENGATQCLGFELCAGQKHARAFFCSWKRADGTWSVGPRYMEPVDPNSGWAQRYPLFVEATARGAARVADFAGHPEEQMRIGGRFASWCACCGRALTDPISLERGIGPECWQNHERVIDVVRKMGLVK